MHGFDLTSGPDFEPVAMLPFNGRSGDVFNTGSMLGLGLTVYFLEFQFKMTAGNMPTRYSLYFPKLGPLLINRRLGQDLRLISLLFNYKVCQPFVPRADDEDS